MGHVLVVDDEALVRHLCRRILTHEGLEVIDVEDAAAAREHLDRVGLPDLLLLDINMPGESGLDFLRYFRNKISKTIPVIMLTANRLEGDVKESFDSGADDYLLKPFMAQDVIDRVKNCLNLGGTDQKEPGLGSRVQSGRELLQSLLSKIEIEYLPANDVESLKINVHLLLETSKETLVERKEPVLTWISAVSPEDVANAVIKVLDDGQEAAQVNEYLDFLLEAEFASRVGCELVDRLEMLNDGLKSELTRVLISLEMYGKLYEWCQNPDVAIRLRAVETLREMHHSRSRGLLLQRLEDPVPEIRASAAGGLVRYWDKAVWEALIDSLRDPSLEVAKAATRTLAKNLPVEEAELLLSHLPGSDREQKKLIIRILQDIGFFADFRRFFAALEEKVHIIIPFMHDDQEFKRELLRAATDGDTPEIQVKVLNLLDLYEIEGRSAIFENKLGASSPLIRETALLLLGRQWNDHVKNAVAKMCFDPSPEVRIALVEIYAHLNKEEAIELLQPLLKDIHPGVRGMAACSLYNLGEHTSLDVLIRMVESEDPTLRLEGLRHLIAQGTIQALKPGIYLLSDPDENVRMEAEILFRGLSGKERNEDLLDLLPSLPESLQEPLKRILNDMEMPEPKPPEAESDLPQRMNTQYISAYRKIAGKHDNLPDKSGTDRTA